MYHFLLQLGEEHNDKWHRVTDRIWSKKTYKLKEIIEDAGNPLMYYLLNGPESALGHLQPRSSRPMVPALWRAFVSEELMLIPEDTELPPDYIQNW